eukprot:3806045-Alexandrium_andersonii.AAC.1
MVPPFTRSSMRLCTPSKITRMPWSFSWATKRAGFRALVSLKLTPRRSQSPSEFCTERPTQRLPVRGMGAPCNDM